MSARFIVVATIYPDLEPGYDGPALSLEEQVEGVERDWPVIYGTRAEAEACKQRLTDKPDPSFCSDPASLTIREIKIQEGKTR